MISVNEKIELENLANELNKQINLIATKYDKQVKLNENFNYFNFISAFKRYLEDSKMTPLHLPVKLSIKIMAKQIQIDGDFELKSGDR